jgi:predicted dehydrogenase/aryl-alcohol dehydrogenase-like predicted oxidoreductase
MSESRKNIRFKTIMSVSLDQNSLRWGILSTGNIAKTFARGLRESKTGKLVGVASRSQESADKFGNEFDVPKRFANYDSLLADPEIDAVYIATPHPMHAEWAIKAADAGKHVLCEKPLTLNWPDAERIVQAAQRNGVQLIEAFMYRCHPQTAKIVEIVSSGQLGEVRQIEASFSFQGPSDPKSRLLDLELGGGGILDVGCYTVSFCRLVAGAATRKPFAEPFEVKGSGTLGATGADLYASALLKFPGDILAICSTGVGLNGGGFARIIGSKGTLRVPSPYFCSETDGKIKLILEVSGAPAQEIVIESDRNLYAYEADAMFEAVQKGAVQSPAQGAADAAGNMRVLDLWRAQIGLKYPHETPERLVQPAAQSPLRVYPNTMRYDSHENVVDSAGNPKKISKIVLGTMLEGSIDALTHGLALFDDFFERGGTCFDTAHIYGGGMGEKAIGHWLKTRGVRDDVTLIVKGAHPPHCSVEGFQRELNISFDRLGTTGDIYMLHRDNPQIPVGEWVDALSEGVTQGLYRAFGGSNWSVERLQAANEYAKSKGVAGFTAASNNFSLARLVNPVWDGCISSSDANSKKWFEENRVALFSWSSQARGFFARADKNFTSDGELVRCWYSDDNFQRLERAKELASQKGVSPVVIAAAYVLSQKFPIYALIGPRAQAETGDSMGAFDVQLSEAEVRFLNLED